jgi:hypothetical protein
MKTASWLILIVLLLLILVGCRQAPWMEVEPPKPAFEMITDEVFESGGVSGLVYIQDNTLYLLRKLGPVVLTTVSDNALVKTLGPRYLAYVLAGQIEVIDLLDGSKRPIHSFNQLPSQTYDLRWSNDGTLLAFALSEKQWDGSCRANVVVTNGRDLNILGDISLRTSEPTLQPDQSQPDTPGLDSTYLELLGLDGRAGTIWIAPAGGIVSHSRVWTYEIENKQLIKEQIWPTAVTHQGRLALSANMSYLATAVQPPGSIQIYRADDIAGADRVLEELPVKTYAGLLSWAPDSRWLAYLLFEGDAPGLDVSPSRGLWVWEAESGQIRQVNPMVRDEAMLHGWTGDSRGVVLAYWEDFERRFNLVEIDTGQITRMHLHTDIQVLGWVGEGPWDWKEN